MNITVEEAEILKKITTYLDIKNCQIYSEAFNEKVKELCVAKLCNVLGINCGHYYKSEFFDTFSSILGEAVCVELKINKHIAKDSVRLIKYGGINFVDTSNNFLRTECIDDAVLDIFNFIDKNKRLIEY